MKMSVLCALATCLAVTSLPTRAAEEGSTAFAALEQKMSDALLKSDGAEFAKTVAEDWKIVLGDGNTLTIAQVKDALASGKLKFRSVKLSDLEVRTYGDTTIVIGVNQTNGAWDGNDFAGRDRFTDVFVKKDGAWKCVASHTSTISEE